MPEDRQRGPAVGAGEHFDVCVVGNLLSDLIVRRVDLLPQWGQEVQGEEFQAAPAGQAMLLAETLAHLDVRVGIIGCVGQDARGHEIVDGLRRSGTDVAGVSFGTGPTGVSLAIVRPDGERAFISVFGALQEMDETFIRARWQTDAAVVCLVGLFNLPALTLDGASRLLAGAREAGQRTLLDTGWDPGQWTEDTVRGVRKLLRHVDVFVPNLVEAQVLTGNRDPHAAASALVDDGAGTVVVKCGPDGCIARSGSEASTVPAQEVTVRDTVGAGDAFNGGFVYGWLRGEALERCLTRGNAVAAFYISRSGSRFPSAEDVGFVTEPRSVQQLEDRLGQ